MRDFLRALGRRWPTILAIGMAAVLANSTNISSVAEALLLLALGYLAAAALQRRNATWVIAVGGIGLLAVLRLQDWVEPAVVLLLIAAGFVVWAAAQRRYRWRSALALETAGMVAFTAISLTALSVDLDVGRYVVAAGWIGHGIWDAAHFRADKVVARSFAEWCAVFDLLRGVAIIFLPVTD